MVLGLSKLEMMMIRHGQSYSPGGLIAVVDAHGIHPPWRLE
jgi:hypothetical protein